MPTVKIDIRRHIVIPKQIYDRLGLAPGDRLGVSLRGREMVFIPESIVERRLDQALADERARRVHGPYGSPEEMLDSLAGRRRKTRKRSAS